MNVMQLFKTTQRVVKRAALAAAVCLVGLPGVSRADVYIDGTQNWDGITSPYTDTSGGTHDLGPNPTISGLFGIGVGPAAWQNPTWNGWGILNQTAGTVTSSEGVSIGYYFGDPHGSSEYNMSGTAVFTSDSASSSWIGRDQYTSGTSNTWSLTDSASATVGSLTIGGGGVSDSYLLLSGAATFTATSLDGFGNSSDYISFASDSTATLTVSGLFQTDYEALVAAENIRVDGIVQTDFSKFQVVGNTLSLAVITGTETSTTVLTRSSGTPTTSTYGDSLSFDVIVSGGFGIPTGTVKLYDGGSGGTTLGKGTLTASGSDGLCTITTTTLTGGTHTNIVAVYRGDGTYSNSTSAALSPDQTVTPASSTVTVTGPTSFTYTGTPQGPSTADKTGSSGDVTFQYDGTGGTTYGDSVRPTAIGTYTCTATLAADANYASAVSAPFAFAIIAGSAPLNDDFADAIELLPNDGGTQTGTDNVDASVEAGEPNSANYHTVWFKWTAPADGYFFISTLGSTGSAGEWDAVLAIYTGASVNALTTVVAPQDSVSEETINGLPVTNGTTYYIQLTGYENGVASNIVLNWAYSSTVSAVTYDANTATGGTAPEDTTSYVSGTTVTVLGQGDLVKDGYTFAGWNTVAEGGGDAYAPAATFSITADTILYAQWTALPTYTLTYDGNGSTGGAAPVDGSSPYTSGTTVTVLDQGSLVNADFTFVSWNTETGGTGTSYAPAATFSITADTILYAQWGIVPANLISNGSFETGKDIVEGDGTLDYVSLPGTDLPGWNGNFTAWYMSGWSGVTAQDGTRYVNLINETGAQTLSQSFTVKAGSVYTVSYYEKRRGGGGYLDATLSVTAGTVAGANGTPTSVEAGPAASIVQMSTTENDDWTLHSFTFTPDTTTQATLTFGNHYGGDQGDVDGVFLDNISVTTPVLPPKGTLISIF